MLSVLHGKKSEESIADLCIEYNIPYICIVGRNYRTAMGQNKDISKYKHKILSTQLIDEVLHYCKVWTDFYVERDKLDSEELAEIIGSKKYVFLYDVPEKLMRDAITITERNGNLSDLQTFETKPNPIVFSM